MGQKFPGKVSRNAQNSWISEMRTIQPKILEIPGAKLNGRKTSGKLGDTSRGCPALFGNLGKCCSTRYWKLPKFKSYFLVELKAPSNFFCILNPQQLTETEKKNWGKVKKQCNSQHVLCSIFRFLFYFCLISTGIHAQWTYLHVLSQTSFFSLLRCFNHEAKSSHMINPHENKNSLYIYSTSLSTKMHLFLQMSHYHM